MMRWGDPTWLYVAGGVLVVLAIAFSLDFTRRRHLLEKIGHAPQLLRMAASASPARRTLKAVLFVTGVTLVALALARPQVEGASEWRQRGIDVAIVMDFSKSMLARDVYPSRIERAKLEAERLIDAFAGDRVAVVAFAGGAVHYPLTSDYEAAKLLLHGLSPLDLAPGSDLGEAILTARCVLRPDLPDDPDCERIGGRGDGGAPLTEAEARRHRERRIETTELGDRARAMVLITDGEDTEGRAREELERAAKLGIQAYIVGVGTRAGDRIPEFDEEGREVGWKVTPDGKSYVTTRLDEPALKALAKAAGGEDRYYRADARRIGQPGLVEELGKLKQGDLEQRIVRRYREAYAWVLFPAFLLLVVEACLSDRRKERGRVGAAKGQVTRSERRRA